MAASIRKQIAGLSALPLNPRSGNLLTVSIGVASTGPGKIYHCDDLISLTDEALYAAKAAGRDRIMCASQDAVASDQA